MIRAATALIGRYSHVNWALADQTMVSGVNFLTGILLARYLGIEEFGRFTLAWMAVLFVNSIQHAAINSPMMSIGPKQSETDAPHYYGAIVVQQIVFSCAVFFLLFAGVRLSDWVFPKWDVETLALPLATAALAFQFQDFLRRYFFTRGRGAEAFANDAIRYLGQVAVLAGIFLSFPNAMNSARVLWVIALLAAIAAAFGAFALEPVKIDRSTLRSVTARHLHFSKWLAGSALMQWTTGNLFILAAGALLGTAAVGALRATQNLMGVVHILFQGLENILPVRAAQLFHQVGRRGMSDYLKQVTFFTTGATAAIALVAIVAPDFWLGLVFGEQFIGYGPLLIWWAGFYLLASLRLPLRAGLQAIERPKIIFRAYVWVTLFTLLAVYPLTAYLGLVGVMAGILMVNLIHVFTLWVGFRKKLQRFESLEEDSTKEFVRAGNSGEGSSKILTPSSCMKTQEKCREYAGELPVKTTWDIAQRLFFFLNERKIKYAVLGDTSRFPKIDTDLDLCTDSFPRFFSVLKEFCKSENISIYNIHPHATGVRFDLIAKNGDRKYEIFPGPDVLFFATWRIGGKIGLSFSDVLESRCLTNGGIFEPSPKDAFIFYLVKKIDKGELTPSHGKYLSRIWSEDPNGVQNELEKFWSKPHLDLLVHAAKSGNWTRITTVIPNLQKEIQKKSHWEPKRIFRDLRRFLSRTLNPTGLHVAFLGPDGCGKTSVIEKVIPALAPAFRGTTYFHLRPGIGRKKGNGRPVTNPHGQDPRGLAASVAKIFYFWFDYLVGWWWTVWPKRVRSTLVLFDRYYHDILVDPKRYRYGGFQGLARWAGKLIPTPDLWILLDAPPEVLQERKQEVPLEESVRQRQGYRKLVKGMKNAVVVDASRSLEEVHIEVASIILNFMAERTKKRYGL